MISASSAFRTSMENTVLFIDYASGNFVVHSESQRTQKKTQDHSALFVFKAVGHACAAVRGNQWSFIFSGLQQFGKHLFWLTTYYLLAKWGPRRWGREGGKGGWGTIGRNAGKSLPKPISSWAEDRGLATITSLIEVRVVNLVVN